MNFPENFLIGASIAAHQVEGNNIHSDFWAQEQMVHSNFAEPSLDAIDHYRRYQEDIEMMASAGLNAYRFWIEWARIEPVEGCFDENEIGHYRRDAMKALCPHLKVGATFSLHDIQAQQGGEEHAEKEWDEEFLLRGICTGA